MVKLPLLAAVVMAAAATAGPVGRRADAEPSRMCGNPDPFAEAKALFSRQTNTISEEPGAGDGKKLTFPIRLVYCCGSQADCDFVSAVQQRPPPPRS